MSRRIPIAALATALVAAAVASGCGGDDEPAGEKLPPDVQAALLPQLEAIGDRVASGFAGACDDIYDDADGGNIEPIDEALAGIPDDVDPAIRSALEQSVDNLKLLVDEECAAIRDAERSEQEVPEEEQPAEEPPPETDTTQTETEEAPPETPTTPDGGNGDGGGGGGGGPSQPGGGSDGDGGGGGGGESPTPPGAGGGVEAPDGNG